MGPRQTSGRESKRDNKKIPFVGRVLETSRLYEVKDWGWGGGHIQDE